MLRQGPDEIRHEFRPFRSLGHCNFRIVVKAMHICLRLPLMSYFFCCIKQISGVRIK